MDHYIHITTPVVIQRLFQRGFVTDYDVTHNVLWVPNLVDNNLHIGVNLIVNTEWDDSDGFISFALTLKFFELTCIGGNGRNL